MKRSITTRKLRAAVHMICAAGVFLLATAVIAQARMDCTKVPRNHWRSRVAISQIAHASGYPVIKAISLEGSCYKVTALTALGLEADAYFDPVTGDVLLPGYPSIKDAEVAPVTRGAYRLAIVKLRPAKNLRYGDQEGTLNADAADRR